MPFIGWTPAGKVTPDEVDKDEIVTCVECGSKVVVRKSHIRDGNFVARHFKHPSSASPCSGGEGPLHRRLKSIALSKIRYNYDFVESGKERKVGQNIADVYGVFKEADDRLGKGVVVEVQVGNNDKDFLKVTRNYFAEGFSVRWVTEEAFTQLNVDLKRFLPSWYGRHYHPNVLDVWNALEQGVMETSIETTDEHGHPRGVSMEEVKRLSGTTSFAELDKLSDLRLREASRICRIMGREGMTTIRDDNRIELHITSESLMYGDPEPAREMVEAVFKQYDFESSSL